MFSKYVFRSVLVVCVLECSNHGFWSALGMDFGMFKIVLGV